MISELLEQGNRALTGFELNRQDIREEIDHVDGILMLEGGVAIRSAGALVGSVGVRGAPGGEKDKACAKKAIKVFRNGWILQNEGLARSVF
jgi:uncharacterized protein GlcG (DUF336 family)